MGILNVTPDSFSDGGRYRALDDAVTQARRLCAEGADLIDIGGESTRPGAQPVSVQEEMDRVLPVVEKLKAEVPCPLSIDTRKAAVMREAVRLGASMINDVSALGYDPDSLAVAAALEVPVVLMHAQGGPETMQENPRYQDVVEEVFAWLEARVRVCEAFGIDRSRLVVDPGIGFGKAIGHNWDLLRGMRRFSDLDLPVLLGVSRKSFLKEVTGMGEASARDVGSVSCALWGMEKGVDMVRVHNVGATKQALSVWTELVGHVET